MKISQEMSYLFKIACRSDATVLINGATGTGKTCLAQEIHRCSSRAAKAFITINLATLHEGTLESELFGHEKGAFTGAESKRIGRLELAHGGTVFLDEVGELTPRLQARLLEFLQSHKLSPVGSNREVALNVRVIAATHRNLPEMVRKREFREDLFHRLRVVTFTMKSLSERSSDFDEIVHACLEDICKQTQRSILTLSPSVAEKLEAYSWPGNIRELRNVLEFAVLASENSEISFEHLPDWFKNPPAETDLESDFSKKEGALGHADFPLSMNFQKTKEIFERQFFERALGRNGGRISRTARQIGLNKATLLRRIRAYQIPLLPSLTHDEKKIKKSTCASQGSWVLTPDRSDEFEKTKTKQRVL